jgi:uncharacterized protein YjbI with pentapeptide repeats
MATDATGADFTGAIINGATLPTGFTTAQLYTTASYHNHDLRDTNFISLDLSGADLTNQDLRNTYIAGDVSGADFTGAIAAQFKLWDSTGFTREQLYSTASYQAHDLHGIGFGDNNITGWNLKNQDLTGAYFHSGTVASVDFRGCNLTNAYLFQANVSGADFTGAVINGAEFEGAIGLLPGQIYSTVSYQNHDLSGVGFGGQDLRGWDFRDQNLNQARFTGANLDGVDFHGMTLVGALFDESTSVVGTDFTAADLRGAYGLSLPGGAITTNAILPDGTIAGLHLGSGKTLRVRDYGYPPIHIIDGMSMASDASLSILFAGGSWASSISFDSGVPVNLDGALVLEFTPGVDLASLPGTTWQLFDWTGVAPTGSFSVLSADANLTWDTSQLYSTGTVTLVSVPEPSLSCSAVAIGLAALRRRRRN